MRKVYCIAGLMLGLGLNAMAAPALKIGIVNFQKAIAEEKLAQDVMKSLEGDEKSLVDAEQKAQSSIEKKLADHQKAKEKMSAKAIQDKEQALSAEISELQRNFGQRRQVHEQNIQRKKADLELKNKLLVESIARQKGYSMVLPVEVLPFVSEEYRREHDITDALIAAFNKAYPLPTPQSKEKAKGDSSSSAAPSNK